MHFILVINVYMIYADDINFTLCETGMTILNNKHVIKSV